MRRAKNVTTWRSALSSVQNYLPIPRLPSQDAHRQSAIASSGFGVAITSAAPTAP
jgi:hypothetical protein